MQKKTYIMLGTQITQNYLKIDFRKLDYPDELVSNRQYDQICANTS